MAFTKSYCDLLSWVEGKIEKKHRFLATFFFTILDQYLYYNLVYDKSMVPPISVSK